MGVYLRPSELSDALAALKEAPLQVLAGGTDFYPARVGRPLDENVLDISGLRDLRVIEETDDHWFIGALATWTDLLRRPLPPCFYGLKLAAREIGGVQVQNTGTICGNVCNASPAADGAPNLMALDARVELSSAKGSRYVHIEDFIIGNRRTARRPNELVTGLLIPKPAEPAVGTFAKLGPRRYLVISIVMVACVMSEDEDGRVADARVAVGACSPVAVRLRTLESFLKGRPADITLADAVASSHFSDLCPIDDVRGTAEYRLEAAATVTRRVLATLGKATEQAK